MVRKIEISASEQCRVICGSSTLYHSGGSYRRQSGTSARISRPPKSDRQLSRGAVIQIGGITFPRKAGVGRGCVKTPIGKNRWDKQQHCKRTDNASGTRDREYVLGLTFCGTLSQITEVAPSFHTASAALRPSLVQYFGRLDDCFR